MTSTGTAVVTLPADDQIMITREFDAPRHLVYRAWTTPELIKRWWAGQRGVVTLVDVDLRVGGRWRYVMTANGGFVVAFHGEYREVVTDERIVSTEVFETIPDEQALNTVTFESTGGRTTLRLLVDHSSQQWRDLHVDSGMEGGVQEGFDLLEQLAASLA